MQRLFWALLLLVTVLKAGFTSAELAIVPTGGTIITNGSSSFGSFLYGQCRTNFYLITNSGSSTLEYTNIPAITLSGYNTAGFSLINQPTQLLAGGQTALFGVSFTALAPNALTATVSIAMTEAGTTNAYQTELNVSAAGYYSNLFTETEYGLPGCGNGTAAWGDYDRDGFYDLLLSGRTTNGLFTAIFHNENGTTFSNINASLPIAEVSRADWGDYDNDGDLDLIFCGYCTNGVNTTSLYRNDGTNGFISVEVPFAGVYGGAVRWGDYNNDGFLDLALCGFCDINSNVTYVYRNEGNGSFTNTGMDFTGIRDGTLNWVDYDNDGKTDLAVSGDTPGGKIFQLYRNNGIIFTNTEIGLPPCALGTPQWIDFDNDGDMDISICGYGTGGPFCKLYRNVGGSTPFLRIDTNQLKGCWLGTSSWGDYDTDGDADLLSSGIGTNGALITRLYNNDGYGNLLDTGLPLPPLKQTVAAWVDINADDLIDLFLSGRNTNGTYITKIYLNSSSFSNTPPSAPSNLTFSVTNGTSLTLSWEQAADNQTPAPGLTYVVYAGTSSNQYDIVNSMSDRSTGHRYIVRPVNNSQHMSYTLPWISPTSTYWWGIQAIDSCCAGGQFSHGTPASRDWLPDFSISEIDYIHAPFTIYVTVTNNSPAAGDAGTLALWLNQSDCVTNTDTADRTVNIGELAGGEGKIITFTNFLPADAVVTNTLRAFICPESAYLEESTDNNQLTRDYTTIVYDTFKLSAFGLDSSNMLRWPDPLDCGLLSPLVHIRFSIEDYPATTSIGSLLYEGTNQACHHTGLTPGQPYYYSIWVSNDGTNFIVPPNQ